MRGVYFIANDAVLPQTTAFLNSLRLYTPDIPLCLIPFNDDYAAIEALRDEYGFTIWQDNEILAECDAISEQFHDGHVLGHYRKLALWQGPFEEFIYIDTDTVILKPVDFAFPLLDKYAFITAHSDIPEARKWVWKDSIDSVTELTEEQKSFAANTGFICSKWGHLSLATVKQKLLGALALLEHMELFCIEQGLLNYLMVTSGLPYTSLYAQFRSDTPNMFLEHWAGSPLILELTGDRVFNLPYTFMVHWAGEWERAKMYGRVRNAALWLHYRFLRNPPNYRLKK